MPHVSQKQLKKKVFLKIISQFYYEVTKFKNEKEVKNFFEGILSDTERLMLAKRFAAVLMFQRGYSFYIIEKTLKLTRQTVIRFWRKLKKNKSSLIQVKARDQNFWKILEEIIYFGLPPRTVAGRYKWLNNSK